MAGEIEPTTGSVTAFSKDFADLEPGRELAALVGMIHQQFDLVPNLSALQNTLVGQLGRWGFLKSVISLAAPRDSEVALAALERVGVAHRAKQRVSRLSGGEQQRVAIARLLVQNPRLILADEPIASLDPTRAEEVLDLMLGIAVESRKTFVASIHLVDLARDRFDRLIGMRNGDVIFDLPSDTLTDAELSDLYELEGRRVTA
jgi:phosphonate transport system ATP-binding protein